ncbi:MAG: amidohydrolase family protein [Elusimicrobia bacterium]|nr:amidohydrolase family protein [Elusimicrobiota bacterium]
MRLFDLLVPFALLLTLSAAAPAAAPRDWAALKQAWRQRLETTRAAGRLPIIDLESHYFETYMNPEALYRLLDDDGVVIVSWLIADEPARINARGYGWWLKHWQRTLQDLEERFPGKVLPVPSVTGVISYPKLTVGSRRALDDLLAIAEAGKYPMLGELYFRRYPANDNLTMGNELEYDLAEPIDGPLGRRLFQFSQRTGIPFQLHYEPEDALIPPLEAMLLRYPRARVIWCHAGRVRRPERAPRFTAHWVQEMRRLMEEHANLYFDVSSAGPDQVYPLGGPPISLWWDSSTGRMTREGQQLVRDYPWRFLAALDMGPLHAESAAAQIRGCIAWLDNLPSQTRAIVAYKAAWKLLFAEELP